MTDSADYSRAGIGGTVASVARRCKHAMVFMHCETRVKGEGTFRSRALGQVGQGWEIDFLSTWDCRGELHKNAVLDTVSWRDLLIDMISSAMWY